MTDEPILTLDATGVIGHLTVQVTINIGNILFKHDLFVVKKSVPQRFL